MPVSVCRPSSSTSISVDINIKGSIEDEKPVSTSVIGSAVGFDPTRPVYQNYDGNVGLGYYMWMGASNTPSR